MALLGAHVSVAGGLFKAPRLARSIGCRTMQIFTRNASRWQAAPVTEEESLPFRRALQESGISPVIAHDSYLINLASPEAELRRKSMQAFRAEMERCEALGVGALVVHPGAHRGAGEEQGIELFVGSLNAVLEGGREGRLKILLETTAGQGTSLGYRFEHLARMIAGIEAGQRVGVCLDTCHMLAAGYDLRTPERFRAVLEEFDRIVGLGRVMAIHLNDSQGGLGSRRDRHQHIGAGELGLDPFRFLLRRAEFQRIPMILETPGPEENHRRNLETLRSLLPAPAEE